MNEKTKTALTEPMATNEVRAMNPLTLAYIGDAVFSHYVRRYLVAAGGRNVNRLTKLETGYAKASGQRLFLEAIDPLLTDAEKAIVKRGRNTKSHVPKNAEIIDYRLATGFEALIGFLSLSGQEERILQLMTAGLDNADDSA